MGHEALRNEPDDLRMQIDRFEARVDELRQQRLADYGGHNFLRVHQRTKLGTFWPDRPYFIYERDLLTRS